MENVRKKIINWENSRNKSISATLPNMQSRFEFLPGTISEFVGFPGVGKTQLCYHIIVEHLLSSVEFHVIFISTTGSYSAERCEELLCERNDDRHFVRVLMKRIKYIDVLHTLEMFAILDVVEDYLNTFKVSLIVIDGIFVPFKDSASNAPLLKFLATFKRFAVDHQFPLIFTNNLTTKFRNEETHYVPYLGRSYSLYVDVRLKLHNDGEGKLVAEVDNDL